MKKGLFFLLVGCCMTACNSSPSADTKAAPAARPPKVLVAYFSHSGENYSVGDIKEGNTQKVANEIARQTGGTLFRIRAVDKYPAEYDACTQRAKNEQTTNARPALTARVENMDEYDVIYLGYPIWWGDMPMPVYTFLESYDFSGKTVHPFSTHEGSGLGRTETSLKEILPKTAILKPGMSIKGHVAQKEPSAVFTAVRNWLDKSKNLLHVKTPPS